MASQWYDATVIADVNAVAALLNSGGHLDIYSGAQPALNVALSGTRIARLTFGTTAFGTATASGGTVTATANAITSDTSAVGGTAGYMALVTSGGATVATGTVSTTSGNLVLNSLTIGAGATVSCSSFTITQAQAGT